MTIKQYLDKYFEDYVSGDYTNSSNPVYVYNEQSFWDAWNKLEQDIDLGGLQWALEWRLDEPALSAQRKQFVLNSIEKYIKNNLKPIYTNRQ